MNIYKKLQNSAVALYTTSPAPSCFVSALSVRLLRSSVRPTHSSDGWFLAPHLRTVIGDLSAFQELGNSNSRKILSSIHCFSFLLRNIYFDYFFEMN